VKNELDAFKAVELGSAEPSSDLNTGLIKQNRSLRTELTHLRVQCEEKRAELESVQGELEKSQSEAESLRIRVEKLEMDLYNYDEKREEKREERNEEEEEEGGVSPQSESGPSKNSVSSIITSQRDRFRRRCEELEKQLRASQNVQSQLSFEVEKLKKDNVELYGKIRYMSSYGNGSSTSRSETMEGRYREMYEEDLDPFKRFNQRVRK
jgi:homeobox protein cut-like